MDFNLRIKAIQIILETFPVQDVERDGLKYDEQFTNVIKKMHEDHLNLAYYFFLCKSALINCNNKNIQSLLKLFSELDEELDDYYFNYKSTKNYYSYKKFLDTILPYTSVLREFVIKCKPLFSGAGELAGMF